MTFLRAFLAFMGGIEIGEFFGGLAMAVGAICGFQ